MRPRLHTALCLGACLLLTACTGPAPPPQAASPAGMAAWHQLASAWPGAPATRTRVVAMTDRRTGNTHHLLYRVELHQDALLVVALSPLGVPLYRVQAVRGQVQSEAFIDALAGLPLERMLQDYVLSEWPLASVQAAARASGQRVSAIANGRTLHSAAGQLLVEVHYGADSTRIVHHDLPLDIVVTDGDAAP